MSTTLNKGDFNKENIKRRLKKTASEIWGYEVSDMHGFDPVVDLILGSCAVEFEKIAQEISNSQTRSLERLAQLMVPEVYTGPKPAHLILKAKPIELTYELSFDDQMHGEKELFHSGKAAESLIKSVYFSPAVSQKLFDGSLTFIAHGKKIFEVMDTGVKTELCETASDQYLDFSDLWLGIQLNHKIDNINGLSFYFNWKEIPGHLKFYQSISLAKWFINDHEINVEAGLLNNNTNQISNDDKIFLFDISRKFETYIKAHYSDRFFRVVDNVNINSESKYPYPNTFKEVFESNDLKNFKEDILWIRIDGSHAISEQSVIEADIGINCFPAFNRRLHSGRPFALEKDFNIIPLKTEDSFFSVKRVFAKHKGEYSQIPFGQIGEQKTETYTLRKGGIGRFEKRNAKEMLEYILELMRDESAAFKAWDDRLLAKEIRILDQNLNRLEQNVAQKSSHGDSYHYLLINSKKSEDVWIEFWSTTGLVGNSITQGNLFKTTSINLKKDSVISMSQSVGGMDGLKSDDTIFAYKSALLSRNRLVTKEDIKAACYAEMGSEVKNIEIKQGIMIGDSMKEGLSRSIDILLQAKPDLNRSSDELNQLARQLKVVLESKMAINSKLRIKFIE